MLPKLGPREHSMLGETVGTHHDLAEVSGADTDEEEGRCTDGQITNSTAIANTPGLRAEGRWPWLRSLVVFLVGREWLDERLVRVAFVVSPFLFLFLPGGFKQVSR